MPFSPAPYAEQFYRGAAEPVVEMIRDLVEQGQPISPISFIVTPPTATDQILGAVGRVGQSAVGFLYAQDQVAKTFYALGFIVAGTAAGFSSSAVLSKACSITIE